MLSSSPLPTISLTTQAGHAAASIIANPADPGAAMVDVLAVPGQSAAQAGPGAPVSAKPAQSLQFEAMLSRSINPVAVAAPLVGTPLVDPVLPPAAADASPIAIAFVLQAAPVAAASQPGNAAPQPGKTLPVTALPAALRPAPLTGMPVIAPHKAPAVERAKSDAATPDEAPAETTEPGTVTLAVPQQSELVPAMLPASILVKADPQVQPTADAPRAAASAAAPNNTLAPQPVRTAPVALVPAPAPASASASASTAAAAAAPVPAAPLAVAAAVLAPLTPDQEAAPIVASVRVTLSANAASPVSAASAVTAALAAPAVAGPSGPRFAPTTPLTIAPAAVAEVTARAAPTIEPIAAQAQAPAAAPRSPARAAASSAAPVAVAAAPGAVTPSVEPVRTEATRVPNRPADPVAGELLPPVEPEPPVESPKAPPIVTVAAIADAPAPRLAARAATVARGAASSQIQPRTPIAAAEPGPVAVPATTIVPFAPAQIVSTVAPAASAAPQPERIDFGALVDTIARAREQAAPLTASVPVAVSLAHADFGPVALRFRHEGDALSVTMASADPGFAPAVAAATNADAARAGQQQQQQQSADTPSRRDHQPAAQPQSGYAQGGANANAQGQPQQRFEPRFTATARPAANPSQSTARDSAGDEPDIFA